MCIAQCDGVMDATKSELLFLCVAACTIFAATPAAAQTAIIEGAASLGSGASLGTGNGETVVLASPLYLDADVIFYNSEFPKTEYVIGLQAELTGRVSAGIVPQIRLTTGPKKVMVYGLAGVPFVFAPFVMLGVEVGGGLLWRVFPRVGAFAEVVADLFFIGNDLQKDGMLTQIDANIGIRIPF